jgi:hypothetical protein
VRLGQRVSPVTPSRSDSEPGGFVVSEWLRIPEARHTEPPGGAFRAQPRLIAAALARGQVREGRARMLGRTD